MKLRGMNCARSIVRCSAAAVSIPKRGNDYGSVFSVSKIHITPGDIGNLGRRRRCGSCSIGRSLSRVESAQFATGNLLSTATSSRITVSVKA